MSRPTLKLLSLLVLVSFSPIREVHTTEPIPRFGSGIALLLSEGQGFYTSVLSPRGDFVAAVIDEYDFTRDTLNGEYVGSTVQLWDIQNIRPEGAVTSLKPAAIRVLNLSYPDDLYPQAAISISPDAQFIALQLATEALILTPPELEQYKSIAGVGQSLSSGVLSWTSDSRLLGILFENEFVVWDVATDEIYRRELIEGCASNGCLT